MTASADWGGLAEDLLGRADTPEVVLERHGALDMDLDEIEDTLLDYGVEKCGNCGWWVESGEVIDEDGEVVSCGQC